MSFFSSIVDSVFYPSDTDIERKIRVATDLSAAEPTAAQLYDIARATFTR